MSVTRARLPMLVGALLACPLIAAGCGNGDAASDPDSRRLKDVLSSPRTRSPEVAKPVVHTNVAQRRHRRPRRPAASR